MPAHKSKQGWRGASQKSKPPSSQQAVFSFPKDNLIDFSWTRGWNFEKSKQVVQLGQKGHWWEPSLLLDTDLLRTCYTTVINLHILPYWLKISNMNIHLYIFKRPWCFVKSTREDIKILMHNKKIWKAANSWVHLVAIIITKH